MKILIFGDTHFSQEFEPDLFDYISKLIKSADQVIINGDFWDSYLCSFDEFVHSPWKSLFPFLKEKNAIYLFGNHDPQKESDDRVNLFSVKQSLFHEWKSTSGSKYFAQHGDLLAPDFDAKHPFLTKYLWKIYPYLLKLERQKNFAGKIYRTINQRKCENSFRMISNFARENMNKKSLLICGHSHIHKDDRENYLLSIGPFWNKIARYLIIENDKVKFYEEKYAENAQEL